MATGGGEIFAQLTAPPGRVLSKPFWEKLHFGKKPSSDDKAKRFVNNKSNFTVRVKYTAIIYRTA